MYKSRNKQKMAALLANGMIVVPANAPSTLAFIVTIFSACVAVAFQQNHQKMIEYTG